MTIEQQIEPTPEALRTALKADGYAGLQAFFEKTYPKKAFLRGFEGVTLKWDFPAINRVEDVPKVNPKRSNAQASQIAGYEAGKNVKLNDAVTGGEAAKQLSD